MLEPERAPGTELIRNPVPEPAPVALPPAPVPGTVSVTWNRYGNRYGTGAGAVPAQAQNGYVRDPEYKPVELLNSVEMLRKTVMAVTDTWSTVRRRADASAAARAAAVGEGDAGAAGRAAAVGGGAGVVVLVAGGGGGDVAGAGVAGSGGAGGAGVVVVAVESCRGRIHARAMLAIAEGFEEGVLFRDYAMIKRWEDPKHKPRRNDNGQPNIGTAPVEAPTSKGPATC